MFRNSVAIAAAGALSLLALHMLIRLYAFAVGVVPATVLAAEPKNVVFVLIDTLRADRLGAYGCTQENISPSIDALAKQSVLFEQPISQAHWTIPSVGAIFTGVYPTVSGQSKKVKVGVPPLPDSLETMAEHFSASGMDTASFVQNNVLGASNGYAQGFDTWRVVRPNAIRSVGSATFMTDLAVDWLDGHRGDPDPFFLYVHYTDPHAGYMANEPYYKRYLDPTYDGPVWGTENEIAAMMRARSPDDKKYAAPMMSLYDGEVAYVDSEVGRLLRKLAELGLDDDTVFVLTSDHGEQFAEHGGWQHQELYQENILVPLIVRAPGIEPRRVSGWVENFRIAPTLFDLMGLPAWEHAQATSLVPQMKGAPVPAGPVYSEHALFKTLIDGDQKIIARTKAPRRATGISRLRVFNLSSDPLEHTDLSDQDQLCEPLLKQLQAVHAGNVERQVEATDTETSDEVIEALRTMGYIE